MPKGTRSYDTIQQQNKTLVNLEKLMDILEAYGLKYSPSHIRHLTRQGGIPGQRHRYRWYYDADAVIAALTKADDQADAGERYINARAIDDNHGRPAARAANTARINCPI